MLCSGPKIPHLQHSHCQYLFWFFQRGSRLPSQLNDFSWTRIAWYEVSLVLSLKSQLLSYHFFSNLWYNRQDTDGSIIFHFSWFTCFKNWNYKCRLPCIWEGWLFKWHINQTSNWSEKDWLLLLIKVESHSNTYFEDFKVLRIFKIFPWGTSVMSKDRKSVV